MTRSVSLDSPLCLKPLYANDFTGCDVSQGTTSWRACQNPRHGQRVVSNDPSSLSSSDGQLPHGTPISAYALFNTSESTAKMVRMGLRAHIGAHGESPLGLNYHAEMFFTRQGGLTNYEVCSATVLSSLLYAHDVAVL